jgi:hypothetical protein
MCPLTGIQQTVPVDHLHRTSKGKYVHTHTHTCGISSISSSLVWCVNNTELDFRLTAISWADFSNASHFSLKTGSRPRRDSTCRSISLNCCQSQTISSTTALLETGLITTLYVQFTKIFRMRHTFLG